MKNIIKGCIAEIESDIIKMESNTFLPEVAKTENIERLMLQKLSLELQYLEAENQKLMGLVDSNIEGDKGEYIIKAK